MLELKTKNKSNQSKITQEMKIWGEILGNRCTFLRHSMLTISLVKHFNPVYGLVFN